MKKYMFIIALSACAGPGTNIETIHETTHETTRDVPGATVTVEVPTPPVPLTAVEELIMDENDYRLSLGQLPLTPGVTCSLYNLLNGAVPTPPQPQPSSYPTSLPSSTSTFTYKGVFNQAGNDGSLGLDVVPKSIRALYTQWYAIRCTGTLVVLDSGYHNFELNSDDASLLYIDNAIVVNNDGQHAMTSKNGTKQLHSGVHSFRLDYMEGSGPMGLILNMDGATLPSTLLYR